MFLQQRLWSLDGRRERRGPAGIGLTGLGLAGLGLVGAAFVLGLVVGSAIGPRSASIGIGVMAEPALQQAAVPSTTSAVRSVHPAEVLRVQDGDTFEARVHLWPGLDITTRVRLRGIDAPELRARCAEERDKAEAARDALRALLAQGEVGVGRVTLDKYGGRVVADAMTHATPDVARALLEAGVVRRYSGGRRESWCP